MKRINIYIIMAAILCVGQNYAQNNITLEQSKQLALQNNVKNKNSRLQIEASRQTRKSAFTNYFPSISAGGMIFGAQKPMMEMESKGGNLPVYDGNPANLGTATQFAYFPSTTTALMKKGKVGFVNAIQPIFAGGRIVNGNKLASLGEEVSEYQSKLAKDETLLKTEQQYWQIVSLEEKTKTIAKYEELLNSLLNKVSDAFNSGVAMVIVYC